jgi:hypothetical protein
MHTYIKGMDTNSRRLLVSLTVIVSILMCTWATGPIASIVLIAAHVDGATYSQVYGLIAGVAVWLGKVRQIDILCMQVAIYKIN